jgi:hypothetical protein
VIEPSEEWGEVDLSHRKLAHRCWYLERGWVSPSTVDRILARHASHKGESRTAALGEEAWPQRVQWSPNKLWCWEGSQFGRCRAARYAHAIVDIASPQVDHLPAPSGHH